MKKTFLKKLGVSFVSVTILTSILLGSVAFAYKFPSAFWTLSDQYAAAVNSGNHQDIIYYGTKIIELMQNEPECQEKIDVLVPRYKQIGLSYAALHDYENSAKMFAALYDIASKHDELWEYEKVAKARVEQYTPEIRMYTDNGVSPFYNAVNEKKNGVLYGTCSDSSVRSKLNNESMVLVYQEIDAPLVTITNSIMEEASQSGLAVEFALNCRNEAADISRIYDYQSTLNEVSNLFSQHPNVHVYLRFAAEFDEWSNLADPEPFKEAFRYVSDFFKTRHSNVAIVWSPSPTSNFNIELEDYYPGDSYVDWVGLSYYAQMHFMGDPNAAEESQVVFKTGINSHPVIALRDIIETYGDRKPIMVSEYGCSHTSVFTGENTLDFAKERLCEYMCYLPMVYPQIKLMAYFDNYIQVNQEANDYRLSSNDVLLNEYLKLTKGERFIQNGYDNDTSFCYRPVYNGINLNNIFPVFCYAHKYDTHIQSVTYYLDGTYLTTSSEMPFTSYIDARAYPGTHTLKAVAQFTDGTTLATENTVTVSATNPDITVKISGNPVVFDQSPVLYNDRTMVPMRKIFEELGATVSWDAATQTAIGQKGDRIVKLTIGSDIMSVNDQEFLLDTAPIILAGRTLVPARAVAEGMGCSVGWDGATSTVLITPGA